MPLVSVELLFFSMLRQFYYRPLLFFWFFIHFSPRYCLTHLFLFWELHILDLFPACIGWEPGKHPKLESGPSQRLRFDARSCNLRWDPSARIRRLRVASLPPARTEIVQTADASFPTLPRYAAPCCPSCSAAWPAALSWHQLASLKWHQVLCQLCVSGANLRFPK